MCVCVCVCVYVCMYIYHCNCKSLFEASSADSFRCGIRRGWRRGSDAAATTPGLAWGAGLWGDWDP